MKCLKKSIIGINDVTIAVAVNQSQHFVFFSLYCFVNYALVVVQAEVANCG